MVISHIFDSIRLVLNKTRRGFVKKSDISTAIKSAILDLYNHELEAYRQTGLISSKIKRFVKTGSITITAGSGPLPSDFVKEVNFYTNSGKEGVFLSPEEFTDRKRSYILTPDDDNPIAKIEDFKLFVAPADFPSVDITYFRTPVDFVYNTTLSGDSRGETFNPTGSVDVEFDYVISGEIVRRALLYLGAGMQNPEALQVGASEAAKT